MVVTFNGSCWKNLQVFLRYTSALVVMGQELKLLSPEEIAEASQWALANGWHSIITPGLVGLRGGASAGVGIFARPQLGLRFPDDGAWEIRKGRAVAAMVSWPGAPPVLVVTAYFQSGTGMNRFNAFLMSDIGKRVQALGKPFIWGGDFNMNPDQRYPTA